MRKLLIKTSLRRLTLFGNPDNTYTKPTRSHIGNHSMLLSEHLHEKAEESRHNETVGYFLTTIGSIFFTSGLLETVTTIQNPDWFLIIPYKINPDKPDPHSLLGLTLTSIGIALLSLGIILALHYTRERTWYMKQLRRVSAPEETELKRKQLEQKLKKQKQIT